MRQNDPQDALITLSPLPLCPKTKNGLRPKRCGNTPDDVWTRRCLRAVPRAHGPWRRGCGCGADSGRPGGTDHPPSALSDTTDTHHSPPPPKTPPEMQLWPWRWASSPAQRETLRHSRGAGRSVRCLFVSFQTDKRSSRTALGTGGYCSNAGGQPPTAGGFKSGCRGGYQRLEQWWGGHVWRVQSRGRGVGGGRKRPAGLTVTPKRGRGGGYPPPPPPSSASLASPAPHQSDLRRREEGLPPGRQRETRLGITVAMDTPSSQACQSNVTPAGLEAQGKGQRDHRPGRCRQTAHPPPLQTPGVRVGVGRRGGR